MDPFQLAGSPPDRGAAPCLALGPAHITIDGPERPPSPTAVLTSPFEQSDDVRRPLPYTSGGRSEHAPGSEHRREQHELSRRSLTETFLLHKDRLPLSLPTCSSGLKRASSPPGSEWDEPEALLGIDHAKGRGYHGIEGAHITLSPDAASDDTGA